MSPLLIGNIISFCGAIIMVLIGLIKNKKKILLTQCAQFATMGIGNLVLGGVTGAVTNFLSIARNLVCVYFKFTLPIKISFIIIQVGISAYFNSQGYLGWLPIIAATLFTWYLDTPDETTLKYVIIIGQILWAVYDVNIQNYASLAFDIITIFSTIIGIISIAKDKKDNNVTDSTTENIK